jgi:hypothetical protein
VDAASRPLPRSWSSHKTGSDRRCVQQANSLRLVEVAGQFVTFGQPVFCRKGKKAGFTCVRTLLASLQDAILVNQVHPLIELAKPGLSGFTSTRPHSAKGPIYVVSLWL